MSRNPDYPFISTDVESTVADLTASYEKLTGTTVHPASPERMLIQWLADVITQQRVQANYAANQNIPSRAEGETLDALGELFLAVSRPEAKAATCTMRFAISEAQATAILIPSGSRVTDASGALTWQTVQDVYIPIGSTTVDTQAQCQTAGAIGNGYALGQLNTLVDIYDYYSGCQNITVSDGGADQATDDEYYQLMRDSMDRLGSAGARGGYLYYAKQVSTEIADVAVNSPTPGVVKLYVLMQNGALAGEEMKNKVLAACNEDKTRPLTDLVLVEDAETVSYDIQLTYYLYSNSPKSAAEIADGVNQAVQRYQQWQCAKLGRDINPDELREYLYHTGIKRVDLVSPVFTSLRDGSNKTVPQVAAVGQVTIVNGGYESE